MAAVVSVCDEALQLALFPHLDYWAANFVLACRQGRAFTLPERKIMKISPNVKPALWGAVGGAIALAIIGFSWGGWVTGSTASTMAQDHANIEIAKVLAPICFLQFQQQPDAMAKLVELKGMNSTYQQATFVEKSGAAMMPGGDKPLRGVGQACADLLLQAAK
jgi:hypothetical protein